MIITAVGSCLALEGLERNNIPTLYKEIFSGEAISEEMERIRSVVMKKMDGYDFADIIKAGEECSEDLEKSLASHER